MARRVRLSRSSRTFEPPSLTRVTESAVPPANVWGERKPAYWIVDGRGNKVDVALTDIKTGGQLADSLFKYDGPDAGEIRRGGR